MMPVKWADTLSWRSMQNLFSPSTSYWLERSTIVSLVAVMSTSEPTPEEEAAARAKEGDDDFLTAYCLAAEQAALPYKWTQTLEYVDLVIPFPAGTRARELAVTMTKKKLSVGLKGKDPIISVCVTRILPTNTCRASFTRRSRWMTALGLLVRSAPASAVDK